LRIGKMLVFCMELPSKGATADPRQRGLGLGMSAPRRSPSTSNQRCGWGAVLHITDSGKTGRVLRLVRGVQRGSLTQDSARRIWDHCTGYTPLAQPISPARHHGCLELSLSYRFQICGRMHRHLLGGMIETHSRGRLCVGERPVRVRTAHVRSQGKSTSRASPSAVAAIALRGSPWLACSTAASAGLFGLAILSFIGATDLRIAEPASLACAAMSRW
jgi:hypothetical protein